MKVIDETFDFDKEKNIDLNFDEVVDFGKAAYQVCDGKNEYDKMILKSDFHQILKILKPMELQIITLRYGLADNDPKTLKEIAQICNRSQQTIRVHHNLAIRKLEYLTLYCGLDGEKMNISQISKATGRHEEHVKWILGKCDLTHIK